MKALLLESTGGPDALRLAEVDDPVAGEGMVLIEVHAAGVGFVDMLVTRGEYQIKPELPFVPGIEVAGIVREAPADAAVRPGDRVAATTAFGAFAELAVAPAMLTFALPDELDFEAAAGFVVNHQTAHLALARRGRLAPGETVLVHGAAGGVGTASIQVAKALDAGMVIGVARGEQKRAVVLATGADEAVDPDDDWIAAVRELTGGRGADVVVDPVGGDRFDGSLKCMAPEGRLLVVGFAEGRIPTLAVNRLLLRSIDVVGVNFGGMLAFDQRFAARAWDDLARWVREGALRPVVGASYPLADGAEALRDFEARRVTGKPVLRVRPAAV